jgi:DNA-binding PadR family transcriptional regulator
MRAEVLKGHLETLLLASVAAEPAHGYRIVERLRERSGGVFSLAEGTIYPALYRLETSGLLRSRWDRSTGRPRRVYRITAKGRAALAGGREEWAGFARAMQAVLQ